MAESTAGKWHVNGDGVPDVCRAKKGNCPFGSTGLGHFDTKQEAEAAYAGYAAAMAKMNGTSSLSKKTTTGDAAGDTVEAMPRTIGEWQDKLKRDASAKTSSMEPTAEARVAMRSLRRVNKIDAETSRKRCDAVSALGDKISADLAAGRINDSDIQQYNEDKARLNYLWDVRDRLNVGMTPEQAKLDAAAAAIDEYQKAEAGDSEYEDADLMALKACAGVAMDDVFQDWELNEDMDWSISADDEREFEEDLSQISVNAVYSKEKTGGDAYEGFLNGFALDPRAVKALSKANWELAAIHRINERRTEHMEEGQKRTMFEAAKDYVFANGVHSYNPYNRSTSTIANAMEDGEVEAKMAIASLVFSYGASFKKSAQQEAQIAQLAEHRQR